MIDSLTSLRFFAAFAIVLHHAKGLVFSSEFMKGVPLSSGVSFFFVLSGFILSYVYSGRMGSVGLYNFYTSRFSKIWPPHILTFVLLVVLIPTNEGWIIALLNASLLQSVVPIPAYYFSFNSVSWSISAELFFYAAFPLLMAGLNKNWHIKLVALLLLGGVGAYIIDLSGVNYYSPDKWTEFSAHGLAYISPLFRIQEFFMGMLLFKVFDYIKGWKWFGFALCTVLEILCVAGVILFTQGIAEAIAYSLIGIENNASGEFWSHCTLGVFFGLVIVCFAINKGLISQILRLRLFVVLGEISFSMYLVHQIVFRFYRAHRNMFESVPKEMIFPLLLIAVLVFAYGIWRFFELPAQAKLKNMFSKLGRKKESQNSTALT
ncbi:MULTISPECIES: acyltransferase family protein [Pseudomonas]|uniref:acyltransferase family protein n=1 Tax=Pseudomonas TaxID=286 RepID=UPI00285700CD|nr:acyltransferase [Pseudomonas frederiksbergensis]MDR7108122.1 peptidoglycan/LPS O-acetylase OafA/YrhL [Pseudomonas frederiksbergensis]